MQRKKTKAVKIGGVTVGGGAPVSIQSMTNTDTRDIDATVAQIKNLEDAGCEIVRLAVPDMDAAAAISVIKKKVSVPIAADIHYDYRLALAALEAGADKLRLNPGNIGGPERVKLVAQAARISGAPIRAGVNSGSLEKDIYKKYGGVTPEGLAESAMREIEALESAGFFDIVISVKSSDVPLTIAAYEILAKVLSIIKLFG